MATPKGGTFGRDGKVTYPGVQDVIARNSLYGQRETGQRPPTPGMSEKLKAAPGKEKDPAGQY